MNISAELCSGFIPKLYLSFEDLFFIDCVKVGDQAGRTPAGRWGCCRPITVSSSNWFQGLIFCHPAAAADCESRWIHFLREMNEASVRDKMDVGEHTWARVWVTFTHFPPQNILLWLLWTAGDGWQVRRGRTDSILRWKRLDEAFVAAEKEDYWVKGQMKDCAAAVTHLQEPETPPIITFFKSVFFFFILMAHNSRFNVRHFLHPLSSTLLW